MILYNCYSHLFAMNIKNHYLLLGLCTLTVIVTAAMLKPVPQDLSYHLFADRRIILGIPNFANVISNLLFLCVGVYGLYQLKKSFAPKQINYIYAVLFTGIFLTAFGSAWYHYAPGNASLVFDRIPMTLVFMAFLAAAISGWIDIKAGVWLLIPLLLSGIGSVLWWQYTEGKGSGDLRFYAVIQFYPMIIIPLIYLLFASPENNKGLYLLIWVVMWYVVAKLCETFDQPIYTVTGFISGHTIKHIAAAIATLYMVQFFKRKYILPQSKQVR